MIVKLQNDRQYYGTTGEQFRDYSLLLQAKSQLRCGTLGVRWANNNKEQWTKNHDSYEIKKQTRIIFINLSIIRLQLIANETNQNIM